MEEITKALQTADLLVQELRDLYKTANNSDQVALRVLCREMQESATKIMHTLNELTP
jgi:hypothetical protein